MVGEIIFTCLILLTRLTRLILKILPIRLEAEVLVEQVGEGGWTKPPVNSCRWSFAFMLISICICICICLTVIIKGWTRATALQRSKGSLLCIGRQPDQCLARPHTLPHSVAQVMLKMAMKILTTTTGSTTGWQGSWWICIQSGMMRNSTWRCLFQNSLHLIGQAEQFFYFNYLVFLGTRCCHCWDAAYHLQVSSTQLHHQHHKWSEYLLLLHKPSFWSWWWWSTVISMIIMIITSHLDHHESSWSSRVIMIVK